jgi:hypothetical protein
MGKTHSIGVQKEMLDRYNGGEKAVSIAKCMGLYTTSVTRVLKRHGIVFKKQQGKDHSQWKGGRIGKGDNYIGIWKPDHERADHQGYVYEHTLVMEKLIGRLPIKGKEVIHHIDFNKHNNDPDNLYLCGYIKHTTLHRDLDRLIKPMLEMGLLVFDRDQGKYVISPTAYGITK